MSINTTKLLKIVIKNLGCVGNEGLEIEVDNILCLVGSNNTGKSTVLRSYELAMGAEDFKSTDRCQRSEDEPTEIELWVHVPDGIENIGDKWKEEIGDHKVLRVKWSWDKELNKTRLSWDPESNSYAEGENAAGFESVLRSRLPYPFRVGALENPAEEHKKLLTLILQPIADKLKIGMKDKDSELSKALDKFKAEAKIPVQNEKEKIEEIQQDMNATHSEIFPDLEIKLDINLEDITFDPLKALINNSGVKFIDHGDTTDWYQQGTGSQRALFWTMLQVRSKLKSQDDLRTKLKKDEEVLKKSIVKAEAAVIKAKTPKGKTKKEIELEEVKAQLRTLEEMDIDSEIAALPGYMLIIDEPEIALHPNAIRAASNYLYKLAEDDSWQIMMTTHSPVFVNPLEDHTTIVRLERDEVSITPKTFKSDSVKFSTDPEVDSNEKETLKMLNRFDTTIAEMFFGQYPILVEGDTEYSIFQRTMHENTALYPASKRPAIVRARGKYTLILIIKLMRHFKIPFSILHDSDTQLNKAGKTNSSWTANQTIFNEIEECRQAGIRVIHRISVPNIEQSFFPDEDVATEDKPWSLWKKIDDKDFSLKVESLLTELSTSKEEVVEKYKNLECLDELVTKWLSERK